MADKPKPKRKTPNPHGREGDKLKIDLSFDEAIRAALKTKPPLASQRAKKNRQREP